MACQYETGDRGIQLGHLKRFERRRPRVSGKRIVPLRPVECDIQKVAVAVRHHWI